MRTFAVLAVVLMVTSLPVGPAFATPEVIGYLPTQGVQPAGEAEHFVGKKLFDYMNGGAELYLAYGFKDIGVRDYTQGQVKATVAVYQMGGPTDAFGIYATAARGKSLEVGVTATLASGMLSFFKGRFYVRVVAKTDPAKAKDFLLSLGKQVASKISGESKVPGEVKLLPGDAVAGSLRYLPNPDTARTVWFDGEGDILLQGQARAYTAFYTAGDGDVQLTRITYPSRAAAIQACKALSAKLAVQAKDARGECTASGQTPDEVHTSLASKDGVLRWVTGADDPKTARVWLAKIR